MITIIDRTMGHVNSFHADRESLYTFIISLFKSGVTHIEAAPVLFYRVFPETYKDFSALAAKKSCLLSIDENHQFLMTENLYLPLDKSLNDLPDSNTPCRLTGISDLMDTDRFGDYLAHFEDFPKNLNFSPENTLHCATALSMEWFAQGGQSISVSFTGIGSMAPLEEVLMGLTYHFPDSFTGDLSALQTAKSAFLEFSREVIPANKPVLGERIFKVESGIHVDGILKNPSIYEPFDPQIVGQQREIVLGKHSGQKSITHKLKDYQLSDLCLKKILSTIKEQCTHLGRNLSDLELATLVMEVQND
ncbi:hypothetical protein Q5O24_02770 [Eubacteriaceae bacterium ES3]|nr:hypothetical protein Q5O24_02770 [Eubacteriaceae bacterium ES3]